jgi:hypothetical protein
MACTVWLDLCLTVWDVSRHLPLAAAFFAPALTGGFRVKSDSDLVRLVFGNHCRGDDACHRGSALCAWMHALVGGRACNFLIAKRIAKLIEIAAKEYSVRRVNQLTLGAPDGF